MMDSSSVADALKAIAEGSWQQWLVRVGVTMVVLFITSYAMKVLHHLNPKKPPGPFPIWPVLGNLSMVGTLPHRNFYEMAKKYGDIMELHLGSSRTVVISSPALLKEMCKDKDQIFASRPPNVAGEIIMYGRKDIVWSPYGSHWRHMRKVCVLELFTAKRLDSSKPIREDEFAHLIDDIYRNGKVNRFLSFSIFVLNLFSLSFTFFLFFYFPLIRSPLKLCNFFRPFYYMTSKDFQPCCSF